MHVVEKQIMLDDKKITYTLSLKDKTRTMRIAIYPGGQMKVSAPARLGERAVERFIVSRSEWVLRKISTLALVQAPVSGRASYLDFIHHKKNALVLARKKMEYFNIFYNVVWKKVTIRNQKTRWGSCSRSGNISFNYKIALLPERLADYVVVHELCHLKEMNHSKQFWNLVAQTLPDYQSIRKQFKDLHIKLH